jgi:hypothetical protein
MAEGILNNKRYACMVYVLGVCSVLCSAIFANGYVAAVSAFLVLLSVAYFNSGHVINNFLIKRSAIIEMYDGFKVSRNLDSLVKKTNEGYIAIATALVRIDSKKTVENGKIKELIEGIRVPFEFSIALKEVDGKKLLESMETRRRMREIVLSRVSRKKEDKINSLRREIDVINDEISNIKKGGKALDMTVKISSFSSSVSELEAVREVSSNIKQVGDSFSVTFGVGYDILKGEELIEFIGVYY